MNFETFFFGREFKSQRAIVRLVSTYPNFNPAKENIDEAELLLIFKTTKQQTWLIATERGLYCVLDDLGRGSTIVRWRIPSTALVHNGDVIAQIAVEDWKEKTGLISIESRRHWLFTKSLFLDEPIEKQISNMLLKRMS